MTRSRPLRVLVLSCLLHAGCVLGPFDEDVWPTRQESVANHVVAWVPEGLQHDTHTFECSAGDHWWSTNVLMTTGAHGPSGGIEWHQLVPDPGFGADQVFQACWEPNPGGVPGDKQWRATVRVYNHDDGAALEHFGNDFYACADANGNDPWHTIAYCSIGNSMTIYADL